jgi:hypothetical protein
VQCSRFQAMPAVARQHPPALALGMPAVHATESVSCWLLNALQDVCIVEMREPAGWVVVPLAATQANKHLRAFHLQVRAEQSCRSRSLQSNLTY